MSLNNNEASSGKIVLENSPCISEASTLYETMKCFIATDQDVVIDATGVESTDTATIQLLVAFSSHVENSENEISWVGGSEAFCKTATSLGLDRYVDCDG